MTSELLNDRKSPLVCKLFYLIDANKPVYGINENCARKGKQGIPQINREVKPIYCK